MTPVWCHTRDAVRTDTVQNITNKTFDATNTYNGGTAMGQTVVNPQTTNQTIVEGPGKTMYIRKLAVATVRNNTVTYINDTELVFTLIANATYEFDLMSRCKHSSNASNGGISLKVYISKRSVLITTRCKE